MIFDLSKQEDRNLYALSNEEKIKLSNELIKKIKERAEYFHPEENGAVRYVTDSAMPNNEKNGCVAFGITVKELNTLKKIGIVTDSFIDDEMFHITLKEIN